MRRKRIAVDIDGTLCPEGPASERMYAESFADVREQVNRAYDMGHRVVLYTARHWADDRMTEDWLRAHGFRFHQVVLGKYPYDFLLDDRASNKLEDLKEFLNAG